jgi:nicotinate phosphoribosyltransferase
MNETMLIDFYEFTMAYGYFKQGYLKKEATFDLFFRKFPDNGGYAIFAGLQSMIEYIENLSFNEGDISYFRNKGLFDEDFLEYLRTFKFSGDMYAMPEGSVIFPNEPIVTIKAPIIEAQLLETFLLQAFNHQSLIATKSSRLKEAAKDRLIIEMGARRAHGSTSANLGARAAYIGGIEASSNTMADRLYNVPALGTMAHSWVQSFDTEYEAFKAYALTFPKNSTFLIDTFNTLKSGLPAAIKVIKEVLIPQGIKTFGVRIDSGDLAYLSRETRKRLDLEGLESCKIVVSNALDEYLIENLINQGAPIDSFGVGERLITAKSDPVFGGVYKLTSLEENGTLIPKLKVSENPEKMTNPGFKQVYRIFENNIPQADLICLHDEVIDSNNPLTIFDPIQTFLRKTFENYQVEALLKPIFKKGLKVYLEPSLKEIKEFKEKTFNHFWPEIKRFYYPHKYHIDLSNKLWSIKDQLIRETKNN